MDATNSLIAERFSAGGIEIPFPDLEVSYKIFSCTKIKNNILITS